MFASVTPATSSREVDMFITYVLIMFGINAFFTGVNVMQKSIVGSVFGAIGTIAAFILLVGECVCQ